MILTAEFFAIPSSAIKIASERRCAILVHSGSKCPGNSGGNSLELVLKISHTDTGNIFCSKYMCYNVRCNDGRM